jgi:hypothetical protein
MGTLDFLINWQVPWSFLAFIYDFIIMCHFHTIHHFSISLLSADHFIWEKDKNVNLNGDIYISHTGFD